MGAAQFDQLTGQFLRSVRDGGGGLVAVCGACVHVLPVRRAAIVLEERDAGLQPWCASDEIADRVEAAQATAGEGPAVSAVDDGVPVAVPDLATEVERWPGFAEALGDAAPRGSLLAIPLRLGGARLGALDLYRDAIGRPGPRLVTASLHVADLVTASLVLAAEGETRRWGQPSSSRWIHQAAGMASAQLGIEVTDAYARMRGYAFSHGLSLVQVARGVVDRSICFEPE
ncbi:ANTAR domain [Nocardia otitidiscaviarum]|uniref:ANTAR domain n=1 Tax=Nocardia otitidiscaviarum TaxID=1823 RepID=A0A379JIP8_9NOCA|nr:GAF and ANTAR domain-containing protein [Nocardia otitidiscaviarum]MBF6177739.1 GAF and ANTAR domain-containing protein [Nocardia otitidiscaviarum]MCP9625382.1 GAF and ANTAR domain-containing protein [Nocardia otitidiscaviarum]QDP78206.1 GAF and ANTAR domain-containing protein [Nocardia otitidiscaviarum]SUD47863.1 ANTAR domain [Nocardia otitidiscaviarum]